ncbi:tyrosine-type recombinase/integrase [Desemzia incerta]|uniref:tyrosine-type recombinase/integrase n=1 Tax=Desemzia incerta TaxID=82801 RepID=UPI003D08BB3C
MAKIKKYMKKDGTTAYEFDMYIGIDPVTGNKRRTSRRGFTSLKAAKIALKRLEYEVQENGFQTKKVYTYNEIYLLWIEQYKNTVKESTLQKTTKLFEHHILPLFSELKINKIDSAYCQKAVNNWFKEGLKSYKIILRYTAKVFKMAVNMDIITSDPTTRVTLPIKRDTEIIEELPNFYDKEELEQFYSALQKEDNKKNLALFRLLAFTGARVGEILALEWRDIDFKGNTLLISKTLTRGLNNRLMVDVPKTKRSVRTISLDKTTLQVLRLWKAKQAEDYFKLGFNTGKSEQPIFTNSKNEYMNSAKVYKEYIKIVEKYNLKKITIHGFRHTHCSLLFEAGATIKEVQDRLGHSDVKTTMNIYAHVSKKSKDNTAAKFADHVGF